tara:strand:- start:6546 stop:7496 length:951 start_codon:yes stop_codon:yes gene_type:complete
MPPLCSRRCGKRKARRSTLKVHTDGNVADNARIAAALGRPNQQVWQAALHAVDSTMVIGVTKRAEPTDKPYRILADPEQYGLRRVHVPAGGLVVWGGWTAHTNEHPRAPAPDLKTCEHDVAVNSIEELADMLERRGVAVWPGVLCDAEQRAMVAGVVADLRRSAPEGTPTTELFPPGSIGCMIVKAYGLANTLHAQQRRLNPTVRDIFAGLYKVAPSELTQSADAFSWVPPETTAGQPLRCAQFISWAPRAAMAPREAKRKIDAMLSGRSMCHDPLKYRYGGGPGHMSNPKEGRPGHWKVLLDEVTPAQRRALGAR